MGSHALAARLRLGNAGVGARIVIADSPGAGGGAAGYRSQFATSGVGASVGAEVTTGQTALTLLVVAVIGLAAFHLWTRSIQL